TCVVTLEPLENEIDEAIDLVFAPGGALPLVAGGEMEGPAVDEPGVLVGGVIDLGAIATEFLILRLDPYPRQPDATFQASAGAHAAAHPFPALSSPHNT